MWETNPWLHKPRPVIIAGDHGVAFFPLRQLQLFLAGLGGQALKKALDLPTHCTHRNGAGCLASSLARLAATTTLFINCPEGLIHCR